jgi:hypothetical protein
MKRYPLCLLLVLAALLVACGDDPAPIIVYVTPTPAPATATITVAPSEIPPAQTSGNTVTPLPTPQVVPGMTYGPIVAPNYTPEPLHTALPELSTLHERACPAIITAPQVNLYAAPDTTAEITGTATERQRLPVSELQTASDGTVWAHAANGWLALTSPGADLDSMRACLILQGSIPDTTLMGLHVLNGTPHDEVIAFIRRMAESGHPVGTVKGLNGAEETLNEIAEISPDTVIVYRTLLTVEGEDDCPVHIGENPDPVTTAQRWMDILDPYWDNVTADYYEYMNECAAPLDWIAQFSIEMMRLANEQERCLLLFSLPGGNPDMALFDQLLPAYQYAVDHPCQSGRTHGIALHAYSSGDLTPASEDDVWLAFRHRIIYERLLQALPAAADLPVYITEFGIGGGTLMPPCDLIIRDVIQYTYQVEEDPYVRGVHIWNVGKGGQWYDIRPCMDDMATALLAYYEG